MGRFLIILSILIPIAFANAKSQVVVAVVDTGLDLKDPRFSTILCKSGHMDFTGEGIQDDQGHGTHIVGLIKSISGNSSYCVVVIKVFGSTGASNIPYRKGMNYLRTLHPDVVNMSLSGEEMYEEELLAVAVNFHTKFFVAAGNKGINLTTHKAYPPELSKTLTNVFVVGSVDSRGFRSPFSNYGLPGMTYEPGENQLSTLPNGKWGFLSGTSQSTAVKTGKYLRSLK